MSNFDGLPVRKISLDLSVARNLEELTFSCNQIRVSSNSANALAKIRFNQTQNKPIDIFNGRRFTNWPTRKIFIDNDAQAGAELTIEYWTAVGDTQIEDDALVAQIVGLVKIDDADPVNIEFPVDPQIQGITDPPTPPTMVSQYFFELVNNNLQTIVPPATNVNGIKVLLASAASSASMRFMAKSSAPSSYTDTAAHTLMMVVGGTTGNLERVIIIPAGLGIYVQQNANANSWVALEYEVL